MMNNASFGLLRISTLLEDRQELIGRHDVTTTGVQGQTASVPARSVRAGGGDAALLCYASRISLSSRPYADLFTHLYTSSVGCCPSWLPATYVQLETLIHKYYDGKCQSPSQRRTAPPHRHRGWSRSACKCQRPCGDLTMGR